jgi:hypothetical protein
MLRFVELQKEKSDSIPRNTVAINTSYEEVKANGFNQSSNWIREWGAWGSVEGIFLL